MYSFLANSGMPSAIANCLYRLCESRLALVGKVFITWMTVSITKGYKCSRMW